MTKDDGGPAFPHSFEKTGHPRWAEAQGLTARDYFAGQALAGLVANPGGPFQKCDVSGWTMVNCAHAHVADECYRLADAMLKARG